MERIVLATGNKGKIREFERAFSHMNITCVPVKDIVDVPEPEETGTTFMENAAGVHGDDEANNEKLIRELQGKSDRTAHYVCALALVHPDGASVTAEASCDGEIQDTPVGTNGFGYDPYFFVPQFGKTMAELDIDTKETISHRGKALQELVAKVNK